MEVLITGATGFLGRFLTKRLQQENYNVIPLGSQESNLCDSNALSAYKAIKFDYIFHLAAWTQAGDFCVYHPGEQWLINQQINTTVLNWWSKYQPQAKLVSIGTSCSYDESLPHREENYLIGTPRDELFIYAMTKRMLLIGQIALNKQYGLSYLTVIPSTLVGPYYNFENKQPHFIFDLIKKIIDYKENKKKVVLWGDGYQRRELVYVEDFVDILLLLDKVVVNEVYNIGAGRDYSIRDFVFMICEILNVDATEIQYDENRYVGAKAKFLDNSKLNSTISEYKQKPLEDVLELTIDWMYSKLYMKSSYKIKPTADNVNNNIHIDR
jgi:GDP-L-fucose synthase